MYNKLIILGSNGMLGGYMKRYFETNTDIQVICINRDVYDVLKDDITKLGIILKDHLCETTVLINCIGIIPQSGKDHVLTNDNYIRVNKDFPRELSALCKLYNCKMIHSTTDCVYSGLKGKYTENDIHDTNDIYGKSKSNGEPDNCCVIRTSIIGEEITTTRSLVEWLKSNNCGRVNGYTNHYWNGITCLQYAKIVHKMMVTNKFWEGVRHIFSPNIVSKYELLKLINDIYKLNIDIDKYEIGNRIDRSISTIYSENSYFNIPDLKQQILEMYIFSSTLYNYIIPKVLYIYWDGNILSYLQYLTIVTFQKHNPDWKVILYMPIRRFIPITWSTNEQKNGYDGKNFLPDLLKLNITIRIMDFEKIGFKNEVSEVFKSDYIRYWLLGNYGGMWADMDIIFIAPMSNLFKKELYDINYKVYGDHNKIDTVICHYYPESNSNYSVYPIGLLLSSPNNKFYLELLNNAVKYLDTSSYQSMGCILIRNLFRDPHNIIMKYPELNMLCINGSAYLPYGWNQIEKIFLVSYPENIKQYTIGIHWFNGNNHTTFFQSMIDNNTLPKTGSIYPYIKEYVDK